jgi:DNA-binding response OmpR family regulator
LVVDDDPAVGELIRLRLEKIGCEVWVANSGKEALSQIEARGLPHLGVIDVMMPGMNGFELCEAIQSWSDLPVIMLTALGSQQTVGRGIRFSVEDYITKPFRSADFLTRVARVLRRAGSFAYPLDTVLVVDAQLVVDFPHQQILVDDVLVALTPTESKILYILMRQADRPVSSEQLLHRLWPKDERYEDVLKAHMMRLQQKVEPDVRHPRHLRAEGAGYCFYK